MSLRIGLLGASRIAPKAVIAPAARRTDVRITAVAARDQAKAHAYATTYAIAAVADGYAALCARDDVDLVYCALPPAAHLDACLTALAAGKALLVEKPFAMTAQDAARIVQAADAAGRPALEAFHYRFHGQTGRALEWLHDGAIGAIVSARGLFEAPIGQEPGELRWRPELGGGGTMDLGCYVVHALRTLIGGEPKTQAVHVQLRHGVDAELDATLRFPAGVEAKLRASMLGPRRDRLTLVGERGELTLEAFVAPQAGGRLTLRTAAGVREAAACGLSSYEAQLDHVVKVMAGEVAPLTGGADAVANMAVLDALRLGAGMDIGAGASRPLEP